MSHGGARSGAGRKKGAASRADARARQEAEAGGITPLEFMLSVMRDDMVPRAERMDMAKAAAPYIHAKLSSVEAVVSGDLSLMPKVIEFVTPTDAGPD